MNKRISFIIFLILPMCLFAQVEANEDVESAELVSTVETITVSTPSVEELQQQIKTLNEEVETLKESERTLRGKEYDNQQTINSQKSEIKRLKDKLIFADTIIARLSNDCLCNKYDKAKVEQAISNFDQMYSPELKSRFARLRSLLNDYGSYVEEIRTIFNEAQTDKALQNPFTGQDAALKYIDKIKNTKYYKEVYSANWTIPYLNNVIDKSFKVIKAFDPKSKEIKLSDLLN